MYLFQSATLIFKNGFLKWHTDDDSLSTVPLQLMLYVKVLMGVSRLPLLRTPSGGRFSVRNSGYERKKMFSLSASEVICKSPRSIEFLQFLTSFTKIWTIGPKIESKMCKERQSTMERPQPHCMTLLFRFAFQVESFSPNFSLFLFIPSVRRGVSSACPEMPRSLRCAWVTCARKRLR